jgi:hypothetical protein
MNWFSKLIATAKTIAAIVPIVITFVEQVEASLPPGTPGATKLEIVKQWLESMWSTFQGVEVVFEDVWPTLEKLIAALVAAWNNIGIFHKKTS